jgi:hypothetical protein
MRGVPTDSASTAERPAIHRVYEYIESPHDQVADEEIVIYHLTKRERTPERDRLTPRMEARRLLDVLDQSRKMRHAR